SVTGSLASSESRISALSFFDRDTNPPLGSRRCSGIWPPSKPTLWYPPERDFWPLWPRPAVLPSPEPMPRPTRRRAFLAPAAGLIVFNRISVLPFLPASSRRLADLQQVADLADHSSRRRRVDDVGRVVRPLEAEPAYRRTMVLLAAVGALHQRDLDLLVGRHDHAPIKCSTVIPRLS